MAGSEAARLFMERARAVRPDVALTDRNAAAVAEVCRRLDGIPLALELAAARLQGLAVEQVAARMDQQFRLLTGGSRTALPRQQTLRAAIDWSYDLLSPQERLLFERLSVFAGGWTLDSAEAVGSGGAVAEGAVLDLLARLVERSVVVADVRRERKARYTLSETLRQYALKRLLDRGEAENVYGRHAAHYVALAEEAEPHLRGRDQLVWLDALESEHDNIRAALRWAIEQRDAERGLRLAAALWSFWVRRGSATEGRAWLAQLLALPEVREARRAGGGPYPDVLAKALNSTAWLTDYLDLGEPDAHTLYTEALAVARGAGNLADVAFALFGLGFADEHLAARLTGIQQSLEAYRALGDRWGVVLARSSAVTFHGDYSFARIVATHGAAWVRAELESCLALAREVGDRGCLVHILAQLGRVVGEDGDYARARTLLDEAHTAARELRDRWVMAYVTCRLGCLARDQGKLGEARSLLEASDALAIEASQRFLIGLVGHYLASVTCEQGDLPTARRLFKRSLEIWREPGYRHNAIQTLEGVGRLPVAEGRPKRAARLIAVAAGLRAAQGAPRVVAEQARLDRDMHVARQELGEATFASAWMSGRSMSLEQAIAYALADAPTLATRGKGAGEGYAVAAAVIIVRSTPTATNSSRPSSVALCSLE